MSNPFVKATKKQARLRMALFGPSGSGKTFTALAIARALGEKIALLDTEHGSASKYADLYSFDVLELENFDPRHYIAAITAASANGYDVLVIDSLTHAWSGVGGVLEIVDNAAARSKSNNSYTAWREGTPLHNALIEAILGASIHIIATMRSKQEYVLEQGSNGKMTPRKVGLAPVQRDGMEYEFDVVGELDMDHTLIISKSRCSALANAVVKQPGAQVAKTLHEWLSDGDEPTPPAPKVSDPTPAEPESTEPPAKPARKTKREMVDEAQAAGEMQSLADVAAEPPDDEPASELDQHFGPRSNGKPLPLDALFASKELFTTNDWVAKWRQVVIDAKLAAHEFEANGRLPKVLAKLDDKPSVGAVMREFDKRATMTDAEKATYDTEAGAPARVEG